VSLYFSVDVVSVPSFKVFNKNLYRNLMSQSFENVRSNNFSGFSSISLFVWKLADSFEAQSFSRLTSQNSL